MDFSLGDKDIQYKKIQDKINNIKDNLANTYKNNYKGGEKSNATAIQYSNYFNEEHNKVFSQISQLKYILKYLEDLKSRSRAENISKNNLNLDIKNIKQKINELENDIDERKN